MLRFSGKLLFAGVLAYVLLPSPAAFAAGNLKATLARLDASAARFRNATADLEFKNVQTEPVPDTEVQKGGVYFRREGSTFHMGIHIDTVDGQSAPKIIVCCQNGVVQLYDEKLNQVTSFNKLSQYEGLFMTGFGTSGSELASNWDITDDGPETIDGVETEKLDLVSKDPAVRRNLTKLTLWVDLDRNVSIKQIFYEDPHNYNRRECTYTNFNFGPQRRDAFTIKTNKHTKFVSQ